MYISRNLELALLALHSWKSFVSNWMQAAVALLDVKDSSKSIKASKAANDIFKVQFISLAPTVFPVSYNAGELAYHYYTRMKITSTSAMETLETIHIRMYFIMHLPYVYYLGQKGLQHNCWNLIKCPLVPSMSPGFYSRIGRGEPRLLLHVVVCRPSTCSWGMNKPSLPTSRGRQPPSRGCYHLLHRP
jgi:hypothetical protein